MVRFLSVAEKGGEVAHSIKSGAGRPPAAETAANALTLSPVKIKRAF